ncbi:hypothetical protein NJ7G_4363 [Natrinema sp. J7-2]|nr:hypothetical protein NJ7G_4363 [Natrinema sp. J7-2]
MTTRSDDVLVFVAEVHRCLLDARWFIIENHSDDAHHVSIRECLILEFTKSVPARFMESLTATGIAVIVRELVVRSHNSSVSRH